MYSKLLKQINEFLDTLEIEEQEPVPISIRFNQLVEWVEDEGLEPALYSFILSRFDKYRLVELSDSEKHVTYVHLRATVIFTKQSREAHNDRYN